MLAEMGSSMLDPYNVNVAHSSERELPLTTAPPKTRGSSR